MSAPNMHHDWLSLIEISGPFLAVPVLKEAFPQGLEELDATKRKRLRQAYEEWREALELEDAQFAELHAAWIDEVLSRGLELDEDGKGDVLKRADWCAANLQATLPEHGVTLSPDLAVIDEQRANKPLLLIQTYGQDADLDATLKQDGWAATPADRMVQLCRSLGCRLGLVTNGERWMLVDAPIGAVTTFAGWYARIWSQEPITLQAFVHLLGIRRFFVDESEQLPALFDRSLKFQDEVTDALGEQVRRAVEVLIQTLDKADQDRNRELLHDVKEPELYEAALTVMMRLVFLLSAEERGLLLMGDERYEANYALSTLRMQLRKESEEILERRWDAWSRLLAIFRAVFGGIEHENLRLPALGGSLFDPDRFPFLEGRAKGSNWRSDAAKPLPIDNRTVLLLLEAIQQFQGRTLSYRALDVEQIGYVYEGLLERTVKRTDEVTLELDATKSAKTPWIKLAELDSARLDGAAQLAELLQERSGSSASRVRNDLVKPVDDTLADRLLTACQGDTKLRDRVKPYAHLLRTDPWGYPLVYPAGAFIVTTGSDRRETGTHYTPKSLTEAIVAETLTPVVYVGPAEGTPRDQWALKSPAELLDLKICDPAMGSGAFLVQACRWLSDRLVESWSQIEATGKTVSVDGEVLEAEEAKEPLPRNSEERTVIARRLIAERCLYGVDLNPLAVELAKLSIWLVTLAKGRPFGFLDHNLRNGDSLLGIHRLDQLTELSMAPSGKGQQRLFGQNIEKAVREAIELRSRLRELPIRDIRDVQAMAHLDAEARRMLDVPERIADALVGQAISAGADFSAMERGLSALSIDAERAINGDRDAFCSVASIAFLTLSNDFPEGKRTCRPLHWPLEFPEVFSGGGFDAVVGNPPFIGGKRITGALGVPFREYIVNVISEGRRGNADLSSYFCLRFSSLLRKGGVTGMLATSTLSQGETREVCLNHLVRSGFTIIRAEKSYKWPGAANLTVSNVWIFKGDWKGDFRLEEKTVHGITSMLTAQGETTGEPHRLAANFGKAFQGSNITGMGFVLSYEAVKELIRKSERNKEVLFPFLGGNDILSNPDQRPSRWVINFFDFDEEKASSYVDPFSITKTLVLPERLKIKDETKRKVLSRDFWKFNSHAKKLYIKISTMERYLVHPFTGKHNVFQFYGHGITLAHTTTTVALSGWDDFALLQSSIHWAWALEYGNKLETRPQYSPLGCFDTFPFPPQRASNLEEIGKEFHENRSRAMALRDKGATSVCNLVDDSSETASDISKIRSLQIQMDSAVALSYGWGDVELEHGFHQTAQGTQFTISESARVEILQRLLKLNHKRYEEEVAQGLHGGTKIRSAVHLTDRRRIASADFSQPAFNFDEDLHSSLHTKAPAASVLSWLVSHSYWHAKADILAATGITDGQWNAAIAQLISDGKVERQGERRGARYRSTVVESAAQ